MFRASFFSCCCTYELHRVLFRRRGLFREMAQPGFLSIQLSCKCHFAKCPLHSGSSSPGWMLLRRCVNFLIFREKNAVFFLPLVSRSAAAAQIHCEWSTENNSSMCSYVGLHRDSVLVLLHFGTTVGNTCLFSPRYALKNNRQFTVDFWHTNMFKALQNSDWINWQS